MVRLDQARRLFRRKVRLLYNKSDIEVIEAPGNKNRVLGLLEKKFKLLKYADFVLQKNNAQVNFKLQLNLSDIPYQIRISKQINTIVSPFEAFFEIL